MGEILAIVIIGTIVCGTVLYWVMMIAHFVFGWGSDC